MTLLSILALASICVSIIYYLATIAAGLRFRRGCTAKPPPLPKIAPRVALLKPLHAVSDSLLDNLVSFLEVDYPRKEYIFGVSSYEDPAVAVPLALKPRYQFAEITLTVGLDAGAGNRKVGKLVKMAERSPKAEVFVLSDDDIEVERDYLRRVVGELWADEKIGVVTCAYRARARNDDLGARLETLYINTDFMPMTMLATSFETMTYAFGATIAIRRSVLEEIGGFEAVKDLLADDYHLGRLAAERGYRVRLSTGLVTVVPHEKTFTDFWHHQLRWARTYRTVRPISLFTIFIHGPFWALMLMLSAGLSARTLGAVAAVLAMRCAMAAAMTRMIARLPLRVSDLGLLFVKDLAITGIWFASLVSNTVRWGGRQFRILAGGKLQEINAATAPLAIAVHARNGAAPDRAANTNDRGTIAPSIRDAT